MRKVAANLSRKQYSDLRDQFAIAALTGKIESVYLNQPGVDDLAETCYAVANAMMKAREIDEVDE